uniref:Sulfotransferase n=1 Tax=Erpetoichthys calabaricus TaxID=27687 RepID=A0A8C4TD93_ERPCA
MDNESKYLLYKGLLVPKICHTPESLKYAEEFCVRDDDVFAVTYPKSGTTWMQEIIPLILSDGDLTPIQTIPTWDRMPWLEETRAQLFLDSRPSPRAIVSHLWYQHMPPSFFKSKAKVIYVTRNPKDVIVSSFHFHQMATFLDDPGTFDEFLEKCLTGKTFFGKWTDHVKSWRTPELKDRILYITYEEMKQDLRAAVVKFSQFLGKTISDEIIDKITENCIFKNMKQNNMSNFSLVPNEIMDSSKSEFLRKGISGDWKNYFTTPQNEYFNSVYQKEMKDTEIQFPWDKE